MEGCERKNGGGGKVAKEKMAGAGRLRNWINCEVNSLNTSEATRGLLSPPLFSPLLQGFVIGGEMMIIGRGEVNNFSRLLLRCTYSVPQVRSTSIIKITQKYF